MKYQKIITPVLFILILVLSPSFVKAAPSLSTYTVNSSLDTPDAIPGDDLCNDGVGNCTLRAAIDESNSHSGVDTINFGSGMTIDLGSTLSVNDKVIIDASSVGTCPIPTVFLKSSTSVDALLYINSGGSGSQVRGLWFYDYGHSGLSIDSVSGDTTSVSCSVFGLDPDGSTAAGADTGIDILSSSDILIGGPSATDRNTISGNQEVEFREGIAMGNSVVSQENFVFQNNYFGTDITGMFPVSNGTDNEGQAIDIYNNVSVSNVQVLSNLFMGMGSFIENASSVTIQSNTFDLASDGSTVVAPSGSKFISVEGSDTILVGGTNPGEGNVFAASGLTSSALTIKESSNANIYGNFLGVKNDGVTPLLNGGFPGSGISINKSSNVVIGGITTSHRNILLNDDIINGGALISLNQSESVTVYGNMIGVNQNGTVFQSVKGIEIMLHSTDVVIGGLNSGEGNTIAGQYYGVRGFLNTTPGGVLVQGNTISDIQTNGIGITNFTSDFIPGEPSYLTASRNSISGGSAIDLAQDLNPDGVIDAFIGQNINDYLDDDTGPSGFLNHPVLISGTQDGLDVDVTYMLDVPVSANPYRVEFFTNPSGLNANGFGPGEIFAGYVQADVTTAGPQIFTATINNATLTDGITATLTPCLDAGCTTLGGTSEFSNGINGTTRGVDRGTATGTQTDFADNGAYHIITANFLGISVAPDTNTTADETDRDGVEFDQVSYTPGTAEMTITVTAESEGYISAWMDSNQDGDFSDEGELVIDNQSVSVGANEFVIALPQQVGEFNFRIRYTTYDHDGILPTGEALDGEVEDYAITIASVAVVRRVIGSLPKPSQPTTPSQPETILNSGTCPAHLIITNFMKQGDRDGKYSLYYKGTVTEVKILQAHINRILKAQYQQASGPEDGIFGRLTAQGVARLQTALNLILKPTPLLKVDSIVGPFTRSAINNSCGGM